MGVVNKLLSVMAVAAFVSGCVSTEPMQTSPTINLSPEEMNFSVDSESRQKDFGLSLSRNESDSLDNLAVLPGLRVRSVSRGSAAENAGIEAGDIILSANGLDTNETDALTAILQEGDGDTITIDARRGTTVYQTQLPTPSREKTIAPEERYRIDPIKTRAGYVTEMVTDREGSEHTVARVVKIYADSPLKTAGIGENDLIISLENQSVSSAQQLVNQIIQQSEYGEKVTMDVISGSNHLSADGKLQALPKEVTLWDPGKHVTKAQLWPLFTYESNLSPSSEKFVLLDLWVVSLFSYERHETEKTWSLFTIIKFGSDYGELVDASKE